ncbi:Serine/threonine-protein kinase [Vermiconidia calcicola]|uniref:Serine/threonine-protein kinase n=1 Tax=Vermiconidia calcicola TaxID=1690605 RepID=A0ACC3NL12_9PEZI|nr:Serine/threonine-protein kinase [Vermiconidia calcicola]
MASPRPAPSRPRPQERALPSSREPDEIIGDFVRLKEIGKGSFANVYLARHKKKKSFAAIKVVVNSKLGKKLRQGLDQEVSFLRKMNSPHVVALFGTKDTPMFFYVVMEYCALSDLAQFLKKRHQYVTDPETQDIFRRYPNPPHGGLHEVLCRHFIKQLASALECLQAHNCVHRDIKPQNLLLVPAPDFQPPEKLPLAAGGHAMTPAVGLQTLPMLKLADFGFARELKASELAETLCGSPLYMAPEILDFQTYSQKADLWSAGAVLHELVVGRAPFRAANHIDLLKKIKAMDQIRFDPQISISRPMKDLIRKLLKREPMDRCGYLDLFNDPVVVGDIPGLVEEDKPFLRYRIGPPQPKVEDTELTDPVPDNSDATAWDLGGSPQNGAFRPGATQDNTPRATSSKSSDQDTKPRPEDVGQRPSASGRNREGVAVEMQRRPSQREQPKQRRPSMVSHTTAPARQELLAGTGAVPSSAPRMERRPSRASPLTGPPMVREPSLADPERRMKGRDVRDARERTVQDMAFEKEYVMVEKRQVEINSFADELAAARRSSPQGAMTRRATTQGQPAPLAGVEPSNTSRAMQIVAGRPQAAHQRTGSYERRAYGPSPQSATNMLTKALNAANVRLFGALGTSPPFGKASSPPHGYGAYPAYPSPQGALLLTEGNESKTPMDEDTRIVRTMEDAAHRSDVIYGFADVKYRQLIPATPSAAPDPLGIQQIGAQEKPLAGSGEEGDKDMENVAIVVVAEEALVLYVKALAILAKTIDLAGYWWTKHNRVEPTTSDAASKTSNTSSSDVTKRMNNVVQWARSRFNECLEKSEIVGRKLHLAQKQLPPDHPGHPNNYTANSSGTSGAVTTSAEHIQITSGVTAEKLMFDRAVEMSRGAAVSELVGEDLAGCELNYITSIMLLEAVLESDDEPLMRRPSAKKDKPVDEIINGMETEDRQTVIKLIEGTRSRLGALRKKLQAAQQSAKRSSQSGSGNATPKVPGNVSPHVAGTPPR